ncbi:MAG TPA: hypothetical protein VFZ20_26325, partial [Longimicrobium sp.]
MHLDRHDPRNRNDLRERGGGNTVGVYAHGILSADPDVMQRTRSSRSFFPCLLLAIAVVGMLSGCAPGRDGEGQAAERGLWAPGGAWRVAEERRIGAKLEEGPTSFGDVSDVALDAMGRVWIADALQHEIRVFAPDGRHVRSIGGMGGGPAEFLGIAGMDWAPDGNL